MTASEQDAAGHDDPYHTLDVGHRQHVQQESEVAERRVPVFRSRLPDWAARRLFAFLD